MCLPVKGRFTERLIVQLGNAMSPDIAVQESVAKTPLRNRLGRPICVGGIGTEQQRIFVSRFNKIAIQGPDDKWRRTLLAFRESNIFNLCVIRLPEICVNLVFKHIYAANSYTICR